MIRNDKLLSSKEVSDLLDISEQTIIALLQDGKFKGTKLSENIWQIELSEVKKMKKNLCK